VVISEKDALEIALAVLESLPEQGVVLAHAEDGSVLGVEEIGRAHV
jgi:hypothetical protein